MSSKPQCVALANAMTSKGWNYTQLAGSIGGTEQRVKDICTGKSTPTTAEFNALAKALDIKDHPRDSAHNTK